MICPFRVGAEFVYQTIKNEDGTKDFLQKEQRAVYPPCYEDDCPFYDVLWTGTGVCKRIGEEE